MSALTDAAVTIVAPEEIVVMQINDQDVNAGFLRKQKSYQVQSGAVTLQVRYQQYFDHGNNQHDVLKSGSLNLTAQNLQDQHSYTLKLINPPKDFEQAKKYLDHPVIALLDQQQIIVAQQDSVNFQEKRGLSELLHLNFERNRSDAIVQSQQSNPNTKTIENASIQDHQASNKSNISNLTRDQQLIELWRKSSKVERQKFMTWLAEQ
ncbi:DUF2057 family protein [Acinetobacter shaoyimingii]|uniref:DUF2057 domain-containing protein n=1 Tax=Acinetobacter shaoyimingii TaxID=2715164 RepID=A0A6G8RV25_9GAMM|nr:DUF2057 family protein [Acinetobacter shaoyimingii]QIO05786.1 DUF2057 domain-containing protein [Acinetobacter shaoyimingii]